MQEPRILIVEDEGIVVLDIQRRLEDLGYSVIGHVSNGKKAIERATELMPDIVLMDIKLQGDMDGIEAAQSIQELDVPIIYLTAYADNVTLERAKIAEPFGYILKPFEQRELHTTIQIALHKHQLTKKIKESEKWLCATLNSIGEAVIAINLDGNIEFVNPIAESITGWKSSEIVGEKITNIFSFYRNEDYREISCPVETCINNNSPQSSDGNVYINNKAGELLPVDYTAAPNDDYGAVLVFRNISRRIKMEQALVESEALFRTLAKLAPVGIFRTDEHGNDTYSNEYFRNLTGLSKQEIIDRGWIHSVHEDDLRQIRQAWQTAIENKTPFKEEHRLHNKDGQETWVISEAITIHPEETLVKGYIGAVMDITKQKQAEMDLQNLNDELEERVEERTAELSLITRVLRWEREDGWKQRKMVIF